MSGDECKALTRSVANLASALEPAKRSQTAFLVRALKLMTDRRLEGGDWRGALQRAINEADRLEQSGVLGDEHLDLFVTARAALDEAARGRAPAGEGPR